MKRYKQWEFIAILALLSLALQSCLGSTDSSYKSVVKSKNGNDVKINVDQALFKGKIYFTLDHNLYVLNGNDKENPKQLTSGLTVSDPAISPNGKWIAFIIRHTNYSDLAYMPANGGKYTILADGNGTFTTTQTGGETSTAHWFGQPTWEADNQHIVFLGDNQKAYWSKDQTGGYDSFLLDMQLFRMSMNDRLNTQDKIANAQPVAYTAIGAGGLRDPAIRPGHADEILYTSYKYTQASNWSQLSTQLNLINSNAIGNEMQINQYKYHPGEFGAESNPGVTLTPEKSGLSNLEPSFSPDGNSIVYVRREDTTHMSLNVMPVVNGVTNDTNNPNVDVTSTANQQRGLAGYGKSVKLKTSQYISQPVWSPDGTQLAYYEYNNTTFDLWLATIIKNPKTGAYSIKQDSEVQLTQANGSLDSDSRPAWTP
ncbi:TolB family protein [Dictyobacter arantiisoli]|uniref:Protein TolB n=1 Tax=Dictyobacter arantiisoli TaxID=2014874 RepID=A0A5A5TAK2_9CHLR|nr:PD40 domain-containing protein [Dictyobacter arantiisoli]GCF08285.1 hypothetical protein KDI_18490 [Dictyobacter arantiisoli]